jgi:type IV pilus assembly protein PilB
MGIFELITMTSQIREMTFKGESTQNVRRLARKQGMRPLFEDGLIKVLRGMTTLDEILRITQKDMVSESIAKKWVARCGRLVTSGDWT